MKAIKELMLAAKLPVTSGDGFAVSDLKLLADHAYFKIGLNHSQVVYALAHDKGHFVERLFGKPEEKKPQAPQNAAPTLPVTPVQQPPVVEPVKSTVPAADPLDPTSPANLQPPPVAKDPAALPSGVADDADKKDPVVADQDQDKGAE
jgi:hypothetical protein